MAMATTKKAARFRPLTRLDLCRELLEIERDNAATFIRIDSIKAELKLRAASEGKFREVIAGLGHVSVSPARPEETIGHAPVVVVTAWEGLKPARQAKLLEDGLVKIEPIIKGAYYGRVDVKLHSDGAAP